MVSGPDTGLTLSFTKSRVTIGRDSTNDFVLTDGFVSNRHGEFKIDGRISATYRDLRSRHGSLVVVSNVSTHLQDSQTERSVDIANGCEIQLGSSVIEVSLPGMKIDRTTQTEITDHISKSLKREEIGFSKNHREQFITTAHEPVTALSNRFESNDRRLQILFELAGQLNGISSLDDVLAKIVAATFDAFPAANFFALTMGESPEEVEQNRPFMTHVRDESKLQADEPILSRSILRDVAESCESILWVRDSLGLEVSQSILDANITSCLAAPLVGQKNNLLGVMQVDTRGRGSLFSKQDLELFNVLASNVAFSVERARLADSIVDMFESFVEASVTAIEARDPTTAGHSQRVAAYTLGLAECANLQTSGQL